MRILTLLPALSLVSSEVMGQRDPAPYLPTPEQAYWRLLTVEEFCFGGAGFGAVTTEGEIAYRSIAGSTNVLVLFSAALTNGTPEAKMYALCGIRQIAPSKFELHARPLWLSNPKVKVVFTCDFFEENATNVIAWIRSGRYERYLKSPKG